MNLLRASSAPRGAPPAWFRVFAALFRAPPDLSLCFGSPVACFASLSLCFRSLSPCSAEPVFVFLDPVFEHRLPSQRVIFAKNACGRAISLRYIPEPERRFVTDRLRQTARDFHLAAELRN
jgi:hypothetical protein